MPPIPLADVKAQYEPLLPRIREAIDGVVTSGNFILGPNVAAFEQETAAYLGVREAIGVANGTDALVLVLDALGVGPGNEEICPAFTFYATAEAIARRGATPVFADVDVATMNLDPEDVAARITKRTKVIVAVHLFGRPAPSAELVSLGVPLIEDAAQAFGSPEVARTGVASTFSFYPSKNLFAFGDGGLVTADEPELAELGPPLIEDAAQAFGSPGIATTGIASTFSFYPTKNLFALGDGGLVAVQDEEVGERVRMLRFHGSRDKVDFELVGYNSRLDELQAAVLRVFLPRLNEWTRLRREAAARYRELGLGELCEPPADDAGHVYHLFVCRSPERDRIRAALQEAEIGTGAYYVTPLHLQPALRFLGCRPGSLSETERAARENFSLPLWAGIDAATQERVVEVVREGSAVMTG